MGEFLLAAKEHGDALAEYNVEVAPRMDQPGLSWNDEDRALWHRLWSRVMSTEAAWEKALDRLAEIERWRRPSRT